MGESRRSVSSGDRSSPDGLWATRIAARVRVHAPLEDGSHDDNVFMQNLYPGRRITARIYGRRNPEHAAEIRSDRMLDMAFRVE
jgi:hypothetical protein